MLDVGDGSRTVNLMGLTRRLRPASLAAAATLAILLYSSDPFLTRTSLAAEGKAAGGASVSPAQHQRLNLLFTVNNLGYTDTCG